MQMEDCAMEPTLVGANIDTWILNVKTAGAFPTEFAEQLDELKAASQEIASDLATPWTFEGETLVTYGHVQAEMQYNSRHRTSRTN
jgi:hypothetical protein